jgi:hypothetical protein
MRRTPLLFLFASLAPVVAEDYWDVELTTDASRRYIVVAQIASIHTTFLLPADLTFQGIGDAAQDRSFALTTSTPFLAVAGVGCSDCGGVDPYASSLR